jgi:hypothetical protein
MKKYTKSHSSFLQESFVLTMTKEKRNGFYVELGSGHPYHASNTSLLEKDFGWTGLALEISKEVSTEYNNSDRVNKCINADALSFNYLEYFEKNNFPKNIDFLQIDIDNHDKSHCLLALVSLPLMQYRFSTIIIEHDLIQNYKNVLMMNAQREILSALEYKLIGQTVSEDWWIDPKSIDNFIYSKEFFINHPNLSEII